MPIELKSNPVNIKVVSTYPVLPFLPMFTFSEMTTSIRAVPAHTLPPKLPPTPDSALGVQEESLSILQQKNSGA